MNELFRQLISNRTLVSACSAWLVAQIVKTILYLIVNKTFDLTRLIGDGGMPSGHSATVTALATRAAMEYGLRSVEVYVKGPGSGREAAIRALQCLPS